jgi:hypothetical protein
MHTFIHIHIHTEQKAHKHLPRGSAGFPGVLLAFQNGCVCGGKTPQEKIGDLVGALQLWQRFGDRVHKGVRTPTCSITRLFTPVTAVRQTGHHTVGKDLGKVLITDRITWRREKYAREKQ